MRRPPSTGLPARLREEPPQLPANLPGVARVVLGLRSMTPILGGGVESFEPDAVDIVRTPAIRGQLRGWWRALYAAWGDGDGAATADALFVRESRLWGGVGVSRDTGDGGKEAPGIRSRVGLDVEILDAGEVKPAGMYRRRDDGRLRAAPSWTIGPNLGYALFPLQQSEKTRRDFQRAHPRTEMPTRFVRTGVRFRLSVTLDGAEAGELTQVLGALWAWLHFGGLGARTRRGFGCLEVLEPIRFEAAVGTDLDAWRQLFSAPGEHEIHTWLAAFARAASPDGRAWPPVLIAGSSKNGASMAHGEIVDLFGSFRQGRDIARDPGRPRPGQRDAPPGPSRWPEPHLLRVLAPPGAGFTRHSPPPELVQQVQAGEVGAPRAAFGLPIQFKFKDGEDQHADAWMTPVGAQRWPSPLLLRPLRVAGGGYCPVAVVLPVLPPRDVAIEYSVDQQAATTCPVRRSAGARRVIARYLEPAQGDALEAFASWLENDRHYRRFSPVERGGSRA